MINKYESQRIIRVIAVFLIKKLFRKEEKNDDKKQIHTNIAMKENEDDIAFHFIQNQLIPQILSKCPE